jgi:arylsulfatase A-like enzyme
MYAAMRGDFKLLEINGAQFLYNVAEDPGERRNLAAEQPEMFQRLRQELQDWRATEVTR